MWSCRKAGFGMQIVKHGSKYRLYINNEFCAEYYSAEAAADDVACFVTGLYEWDCLEGKINPPDDLSGWTRT